MRQIEFRDVSKLYTGRPAVQGVSLHIEREERVVLFGPSGCGKTTLLRLLAGFLVPDEGSILLDGETVATAGKNLREPEERHMAMVFQDLALWPHFSVKGNLEFGLKARKVPAPQREKRIREVLELIGLEPRLDAKPHQLSGGEQQRVALARALVLQPATLLMDEPLSSLDENRRKDLAEEIVRLQEHLCFTLVYVTHGREEASMIATRVVELREGKIVTGMRFS